MSPSLKTKIDQHSLQVGIIGLGYVGLPLAMEFMRSGFHVTGIDVNAGRVARLNAGDNYIQDVNSELLARYLRENRFRATTDFSIIRNLDMLSICVPTPLNKLKDPDVSYIVAVLDELMKYIHPGLLIVLESTTYPGTTRDLFLTRLEESGLKIGEDFFLCFSPERVDPGNPVYNIRNTPKVIGGITPACTELGHYLYSRVIDQVVTVTSPEAAELVKLLENTFRSINIGLVNEIAIMCEKLGVNAWEVIAAAGTKPFGFMPFTPGPGLGGHCIPIDPHYLAWKMKTLDYKARFIELAGEINTAMPFHVVELITRGLNRFKKAVNGSRILIVGIAYKKDIDDVRESPALDVMQILESQGAQVDYHDPHVGAIQWQGNHKAGLPALAEEILQAYDATVVITDHSSLDYEFIHRHAQLIIDTRNVMPANNDRVIKLGVG